MEFAVESALLEPAVFEPAVFEPAPLEISAPLRSTQNWLPSGSAIVTRQELSGRRYPVVDRARRSTVSAWRTTGPSTIRPSSAKTP